MSISLHIGILPNRPLADFVDWIARAEALGFCGVWVADSQSVFRDAFMALTLFAQRTSRMELATGVTNVITRHPAVLAHSFATLDEYAGGRAVLGVGIGDSSVFNIGERPARLERLEAVINTVRRLMAGEEVNHDGVDMKVSWPARKVPVIIAGTGPKSLQLAGRIADGVLFQVGADPQLARYALRHIALGAHAAGRNPSEVKLYQRLAFAVSENREQVRAEARGYASVAAWTIYRAVPHEDLPLGLLHDLEAIEEQYDYQQHGSMEAVQAGLVTDRILDAVAITGAPDEVIPRLRELTQLGIQNFVLPIATPHPDAIIDTLAQQVMPHL